MWRSLGFISRLFATRDRARDVIALLALTVLCGAWVGTSDYRQATSADSVTVGSSTLWERVFREGGFALAFASVCYFYRKDFKDAQNDALERERQLVTALTSTAAANTAMSASLGTLTVTIERLAK